MSLNSFYIEKSAIAEGYARRGDLGGLVSLKKGLEKSGMMPRPGEGVYEDRLLKALENVPLEGYTCACCGFKGLVHIHVAIDGAIVGPECAGHYPARRCRKGVAK